MSKPSSTEDSRTVPDRLHVSFLMSAPSLAKCPQPTGAEVAFAGRSNSGKSSVLNRLTGSRHTARVSKTPGRTQLLNFFDVKDGGRVVDLPGYGYAKAGRKAQQKWQSAVNEYLSYRDNLTAVVLVTDIRHPNQPYDIELINWSAESELPLLVLLNKADKLKQRARINALQYVRKTVKCFPQVNVMCFSAFSGLGQTEVLATICRWLKEQ